MVAIELPKLAVMFLVVASPALTIVRQVHRITINIWRCDSQRHWQSTSKLPCLPVRNIHKFVVSESFLVAVELLDVEAIDRCVYAFSLILLVLLDMYAALTAVIRTVVGFRDIFVARAFHGLFMGWFESTRCAETIVRVDEVQAVFV
jgi:hypothetical protein